MNSAAKQEIEREHPLNHLFQLIMPIIFLAVWLLDSFVLNISTFPSEDVPLIFRVLLAIVLFIIAFILVNNSHKAIFSEGEEPGQVIDTGIMGYVRHPMYLGSMLIYIAIILTTLSLLCLFLFGIVFLVYNRMASYEEEQLGVLFGEEYSQYKTRVKKWIPKIY
ncbi:MAG: methyltransferase family protein [Candidatus Hodarchaeales archaeon]